MSISQTADSAADHMYHAYQYLKFDLFMICSPEIYLRWDMIFYVYTFKATSKASNDAVQLDSLLVVFHVHTTQWKEHYT